MTAVYYSFTQSIIVIALLITLSVLFYIVRVLGRLQKKRDQENIVERLKALEDDLERYIARSQGRLDVFRKVIDGFDHIIQKVKGVIEEEDREAMERMLRHHAGNAVEASGNKEAEVIRIDSGEKK